MIKLVATDIDGTLLPEGTDQINPELYDAIRELKKRGVMFVAASGRQYASMYHIFEPVANDIIFIAENGSNVMCRGKNMANSFLDPALAEEVVRYLRTLENCETGLSTPETMYIESEDPEIQELLMNGYHGNVEWTEDLVKLCGHTNKICVRRKEGVEPIREDIMKRFGDRLNVMVAGAVWIDFMSKSSDKGMALAKIQELMHISKEETMAFGDNGNDIGMLRQAGESYAVANARPEVKEAAKHIAPANTEDGVLRTIKEQLL